MSLVPHILVVDDHRDIREPLATFLKKQEMRVTTASNAAVAREILAKGAIDLIVLDIMMPGEDGLSLCAYVREAMDTPMILLTARAETIDRIVGLKVGADDYVVKPFEPLELVARINSVLRRANALPRTRDSATSGCVAFGNWIFDLGRRELVSGDGLSMPLSAADFRLLVALTQRAGIVLSRDQLVDLTSGREPHAFDRSIDNQISRLRRKIEPDPEKPSVIQTVWGRGYVFTLEVKDVK
ncbi:response regulator [Pararhizobium sp. YC-54]|uniref:response regulator n=1 Tax=Pararhizobium sp. YC-54 TaxID=2986920 RepID=UPI0021F76783|nr:response regulator [Pararhizobium sp. YC-54]MCW0002001.1 response regulator [Pararhizobium sp. YC-54]